MKIGIKVTFKDPDNPASLINAQFATARSNPEMKNLLRAIAEADVAENIALKALEVADAKLQASEDPASMRDELLKLRNSADDATCAMLEATRAFVVRGFELAGSPKEQAEELADLVDPSDVAMLKVRCLYGAGTLDFTKGAGRI